MNGLLPFAPSCSLGLALLAALEEVDLVFQGLWLQAESELLTNVTHNLLLPDLIRTMHSCIEPPVLHTCSLQQM